MIRINVRYSINIRALIHSRAWKVTAAGNLSPDKFFAVAFHDAWIAGVISRENALA